MSHTIPIERASAELCGLVRSMQPGDEIVLTDHEKPVARIISDARRHAIPPGQELGAWKEKLQLLDDGDDVIRDQFKDYLP